MERQAAGSVFYRPRNAWVGDVIPVERDGAFLLYYLYEDRGISGDGMPWHLVTTTDAATFVEWGEALPAGDPVDEDVNCYTGCVVDDDAGVAHLFYTAQNPKVCGADGHPLQLVAHATSTDGMATWTKHPEHTFGAHDGYEPADWRDPFVFRHPDDGRWHMLLAARHTRGPERRRGVIARCVSDDLVTWTPAEPFWDPRRYITQECPEVFQWGEWWYLVYSEFSERFTTRYRMSRHPEGPWTVPAHDSLDGRAWYAAKSAARGDRRWFFGWIATREGGTDDGAWQWAGTLSVLEAHQRPDGTLDMRPPRELVGSFSTPEGDLGLTPQQLSAEDSYAPALSEVDLPETFHARVVIDVAPGTTEFGLLLRASADGDTGYAIRCEPTRSRMVLDRWPRRTTGEAQWQVSGDVPHVVELERPADLAPGRHVLEALVDGELAVVTLDGSVTLSTPLYDHRAGRLGVFVGEGSLEIVSVAVATRPEAGGSASDAPQRRDA